MDTIEVNGKTFSVRIENDTDMGEPWKEHDIHGEVSDWTSREKKPGELVLCSDRGRYRYYDFAASVKKAKVDGWNAAPYNDNETKGERAAKAARADFERLRQWCNDQWYWVGIIVEELDEEGEGTGASTSLWGIESDSEDYHEEVAKELAEQLC